MPASKTSPEIKAAVLADLLSGEQPAIVALRYGLDRGLVKMWKQRYVTGSVTAAAVDHVSSDRAIVRYPTVEDRQAAIVELVYRLLSAKLEASGRLAEYATQSEWLARQSAEGLAELGGWLDQTALGILGLLVRRGDTEP